MTRKRANCNKNPIKPGDRLLTESPFVFVLKSKYRHECCDNCLIECSKIKCPNCQYVYYCSHDCQVESWKFHRIECTILKYIYPHSISDTTRMLCRLVIILSNGGNMTRGYYTKSYYRRFQDLMSHRAELSTDVSRLNHMDCLHAVLYELIGDRIDLPNELELLEIYGRLLINSFNILDAEMNSIGTGLYLGVSITDHSCKPNAVTTFVGKTLHIHAIEDMPSLDWHKIFISYIDLLKTPAQRCDELMTKYYFSCVCTKCMDPYEIKDMHAAACPNRHCPERLDITYSRCPRCGEEITSEYRQSFEDAMLITKCHLEATKDIIFLDAFNACLQKQKNCFHALNLWHVKTLDAAFHAAFEVGKHKAALRYGLELLPGYRKYYGEWNPLVGLLYMKIAKLQVVSRCYKKAFKNLVEARKILEITHGFNHPLVCEQLEKLEKQANEGKNCAVNRFEKMNVQKN